MMTYDKTFSYVESFLNDEQKTKFNRLPKTSRRRKKLLRWVYKERRKQREEKYHFQLPLYALPLNSEKRSRLIEVLKNNKVMDRYGRYGFYAEDVKYLDIPIKYSNSDLMKLSDYKKIYCRNFYLYGSVGIGKTHIAYQIKKMNIYRRIIGYTNQRIDVVVFPEVIMQYKIADFKEKTDLVEELTTNNLIFDDLGAEFVNDQSLELLMVVLNKRYENNLYTSFTSNFSIGKLPYDARIKSRIAEMVGDNKIELKGNDRRIKANGQLPGKNSKMEY